MTTLRACGAFLIWTFMLVSNSYKVMAQTPRIIIVGSGLAGFSAAAKLIENGFDDIVILEAEDRFGGRINSVPFGSGFIDLGGQWVHGQKRNLIYDITKNDFKFGDTGFDDANDDFYLSNGKSADKRKCEKLSGMRENIMEGSYGEMENFNGSLGEFFIKQYEKNLQSPKFNDVSQELAEQMLDYSHKETNLYFATETWFDISARLNALSESTGGKQFQTWNDKGFRTVFDFIQKKLPDPTQDLKIESKIKFNKEVTNIRWNSDKVVVKCADGAEYQADHVIFTASLGVLKAHYTSLFTPELPAYKVNAIKHIGYGTLGKIFLEFEEPFWPLNSDEWAGYSILWTKEDIRSLKGGDREWLLDINSFIRVDGFPNLLGTFVAGKKLKEFETFSDVKIIDDCLWLLEKFLGKSMNRPVSMNRSRWLTNKNFLGSYSYLSMDTEAHEVSPKDLAQAILRDGKPILLFAGEATDERFSSYAHGAVSSGFRAGKEILKFYKKY